VVPSAPVATGDTVCVSGSMTLTAAANGDISWYNEAGDFVGSGASFTTPNLTATTTYYVQNTEIYEDSINAEPYTNGIGGGGYINTDQYEVFNSYVPFTLKSTLVYAQNAGTFTVQLQDSNAVVLETTSFTVPAGQSRIDLNFSVPVNNNLRLVGKNITTGGLYRNNNSASYPYNLTDILSITGSSAGASYYYYFYDWQINTQNSTCPSEMVPVSAVVNSCASIGENIPFKKSIKVMPNPNNGQFNVEFSTDYAGKIKTELVNVVGAKVYERDFEHKQGSNTVSIESTNLSKGMYLFNIYFEGKNYTTRLVIE
jgi:hypothetical protein